MSEEEIAKFKAILKKEVEGKKPMPPMAPPPPPPKVIERAPTPEMKEIGEKRLEPAQPDPTPLIDWNRITQLSSFQRFIIDAIKISVPGFKGIPTRKPKPVMQREFNKRAAMLKQASNVVDVIRGSRADYRDVMKELKQVLTQRNII